MSKHKNKPKARPHHGGECNNGPLCPTCGPLVGADQKTCVAVFAKRFMERNPTAIETFTMDRVIWEVLLAVRVAKAKGDSHAKMVLRIPIFSDENGYREPTAEEAREYLSRLHNTREEAESACEGDEDGNDDDDDFDPKEVLDEILDRLRRHIEENARKKAQERESRSNRVDLN